jgi:AraC-like DNA-binding protein
MKMDLQAFKDFFHSDFNVNNIYAVQQRWNQKLQGVDIIQSPRRNQGIALLTDYSAVYTYLDGSTFTAEPGDVMLLPKGAQYSFRYQLPPGKTAHPLLINFRCCQADGTEPILDHSAMRLCKDNGTLLPLFMEAAALYKSNAHPAQLKATVYRVLSLLFPMQQQDDCCIGYIHSHFAEQFSIPQLAKRCALSESVYRRRFRQLTGVSPIQYINHLKIEKACQLLRSGDITPGEISDYLHFYSVSYFYRVFKAVTGFTPNEYRKQDDTHSK